VYVTIAVIIYVALHAHGYGVALGELHCLIYWYQVPSYLLPKIFLVDTSLIDKFDPIAVKYLCL